MVPLESISLHLHKLRYNAIAFQGSFKEYKDFESLAEGLELYMVFLGSDLWISREWMYLGWKKIIIIIIGIGFSPLLMAIHGSRLTTWMDPGNPDS